MEEKKIIRNFLIGFLISIILIIFFITVLYKVDSNPKSNFTTLEQTLQQNYSNDGCGKEDYPFPRGNIPASYLGLSPGEKNELLRRFVENGN